MFAGVLTPAPAVRGWVSFIFDALETRSVTCVVEARQRSPPGKVKTTTRGRKDEEPFF